MFIHKFMSRKAYSTTLYFKVLLSFFIMAILIVLSTSFIFSTLYIRNIYQQLSVDSIRNVKSLTAEFDNTFKQISDMNLYLTQVPDVNAFLYTSDMDDFLTINHADMVSRKVSNLNPYIYSIILFNNPLGKTIKTGKVDPDKEQFLKGNLKFPNSLSNLNMVFSSDISLIEGEAETLSIIFNDSDKKNMKNDSGMVITIDRNELEQKLLANIEGESLVVDDDGKEIFNSNSKEFLNSISKEAYYSKIKASNTTEGSFKFRVNNKNRIVTYYKSYLTGFFIINLRTADSFTNVIIKSEITIIFISMILLAVFLLISYLVSKKVYSPIKKVTELFTGSKYGAHNAQSGELAAITNVFNNALEHIKELEIVGADNNNKLKEDYLRRLLESNIQTEATTSRKSNFVFNIEFNNLIIVNIRIDGYNNMEWEKKLAYETSLCRIIPDLLNPNFNCETVNMFDGEIAVLMNFKEIQQNNFNMLLMDMDKLREVSVNTLFITLTIGIGGIANNPDECMSAYKRAKDMAKHRFILGLNNTIHERLLEDSLAVNLIYPLEMENKLITSIKLNRKTDFVKILDDIFELLKRYYYSEAASTLFQIITACVKAINQITSQDNSKYSLHFDEFSNIFNSLETLEQAKLWLINMFNDYQILLEKINQLKNNKHYNTVEKMQEYIKKNFNDPNINAESIADIAGYTSYYFSKIFKDLTGLNVIDYIKQIRVNKAKDLLSREEIKVSDIPELIGFSNSGYFYSIFKKDVGLTPAAYREYISSVKS